MSIPASPKKIDRSRDYSIRPIRGRIAILVSGLDSSVLMSELATRSRRVFPIYVREGLRWERDELNALRRFIGALAQRSIAPVTVLSLPMGGLAPDHWSVGGRGVPGFRAAISSNYIVGRNMSLLSKAAIFCAHNRIGEIAIATLKGNPFPDAQPPFFRAFARAVKLGIRLDLKIATPYARLTKAQVIARGRHLPLELTVSCIRPRGVRHCGACTKCAERIEGFRLAKVSDPTAYSRGRRD